MAGGNAHSFDSPKMTYRLICFIRGNKDAISIKIDETDLVDELKKVIKRESSTLLRGVDAKDLTLYNVSASFRNYERPLTFM